MSALRTFFLCAWLAAVPVLAQAPNPAPTNRLEYFKASQAIRAECIQGRRIICGRILKVLPEGLVVDSGYTNLMRKPLERSWLIPGTVEAERKPDLVEKNEPDCVCVGLVFLTDPPKSRRAKPKALDYVVVQGFPAGHFTYNSVGTVQRTVRRFSGNLAAAMRINLKAYHPPSE
jgi:hypothetical protein